MKPTTVNLYREVHDLPTERGPFWAACVVKVDVIGEQEMHAIVVGVTVVQFAGAGITACDLSAADRMVWFLDLEEAIRKTCALDHCEMARAAINRVQRLAVA